MSVQETKLTAIAEAIREKEGSTEPILASDFPARIRAISTVPEGKFETEKSASESRRRHNNKSPRKAAQKNGYRQKSTRTSG